MSHTNLRVAPSFSLLHTCGSIWQWFDGWVSSLSEVSLQFASLVQLYLVHHHIWLGLTLHQLQSLVNQTCAPLV